MVIAPCVDELTTVNGPSHLLCSLPLSTSCIADSLLSPNQKCCNNTWLGIDKLGLERVRIEEQSQAAPIISFSFCWKLRISCRRAAIQDIGKNTRQNLFLNSSQSPATFPTLWHTIVSPSHQVRRETTSIEVCPMKCLKWLGKHKAAQIP
jgi:hypothetical protein